MEAINPEDRILDAVADAVCANILRQLHNASQTEYAQRGVVQLSRPGHVSNANPGVVNPEISWWFAMNARAAVGFLAWAEAVHPGAEWMLIDAASGGLRCQDT